MPIEQIGNAIRFRAAYTASKSGKPGIAVNVNVQGPGGNILTGFTTAATEVDATHFPGVYEYVLASGSVTAEGEYLAIFRTADTTVDQKDVFCQWYVGRAGIEDLDAAVSSRSTYAGGAVASVTDKTGYSLAATGLNAISVADPGAPANHTTLPKLIVAIWRHFHRQVTQTATEQKRYADDNTTVVSTQTLSDDGTTQTQGSAT